MTYEEALAKLTEVTEDELYDPEFGGWMVEAVETQETIEDFKDSSKGWNESSGYVEGEINGLRYVYWESVQPFKGDRRRKLSVIDMGDRRVALDEDISYY